MFHMFFLMETKIIVKVSWDRVSEYGKSTDPQMMCSFVSYYKYNLAVFSAYGQAIVTIQ